MDRIKRLWRDDSGQGTAEYALLLILIALALIVAISGFRSAIANVLNRATTQIEGSS